MLYMLADGGFRFTIEFADHCLREPKRIAFKAAFYAYFPITAGKHNELAYGDDVKCSFAI